MSTSTPPPNEPPSSSSYTAMETADVEAIGAHCQMPFCHQLDFLPFRCDSCHTTFCLDHRTETAHNCPKAGEWARNRRLAQLGPHSSLSPSANLSHKPTPSTDQQCSDPKCKTFINTTQSQAIHCTTCNRDYCLKHRFPEDHACKDLIPLGARPSNVALQKNAEKIRSGFSRLRVWGKDKQDSLMPKPKPTSRTAQILALNNLKKNAKGDVKVPVEKRRYLHVDAESLPHSSTSTTTTTTSTSASPPKKELWFNSDWTIGRLLDDAAKRLGVQNMNNVTQGEEQRLRVYHVEAGRVLEFREKVGDVLGDGNTVVLLRGVGPAAEAAAESRS